MRRVFGDTSFWLAITGERDQWRGAAERAYVALGGATIVTTEEVLTEFLSGASKATPRVRRTAAGFVRQLLESPRCEIAPQSDDPFLHRLALYEQRPDKSYSLVD